MEGISQALLEAVEKIERWRDKFGQTQPHPPEYLIQNIVSFLHNILSPSISESAAARATVAEVFLDFWDFDANAAYPRRNQTDWPTTEALIQRLRLLATAVASKPQMRNQDAQVPSLSEETQQSATSLTNAYELSNGSSPFHNDAVKAALESLNGKISHWVEFGLAASRASNRAEHEAVRLHEELFQMQEWERRATATTAKAEELAAEAQAREVTARARADAAEGKLAEHRATMSRKKATGDNRGANPQCGVDEIEDAVEEVGDDVKMRKVVKDAIKKHGGGHGHAHNEHHEHHDHHKKKHRLVNKVQEIGYIDPEEEGWGPEPDEQEVGQVRFRGGLHGIASSDEHMIDIVLPLDIELPYDVAIKGIRHVVEASYTSAHKGASLTIAGIFTREMDHLDSKLRSNFWIVNQIRRWKAEWQHKQKMKELQKTKIKTKTRTKELKSSYSFLSWCSCCCKS